MTYLPQYGPNFRWCVRTLRVRGGLGRWCKRTPTLSAGLSDHVGNWREWFTRPSAQST